MQGLIDQLADKQLELGQVRMDFETTLAECKELMNQYDATKSQRALIEWDRKIMEMDANCKRVQLLTTVCAELVVRVDLMAVPS